MRNLPPPPTDPMLFRSGIRRKERPRPPPNTPERQRVPSREEASNTVPYLFHVFRKTNAWCADKMNTVRSVRTRLLEMSRCRAREPRRAELLLDFAFTVADSFEEVIVPTFLEISLMVRGVEGSMPWSVDEEDEGEEDEAMIVTVDGIEDECCVLSDEYVSLLPTSVYSSAQYLFNEMRTKTKSLIWCTKGLDLGLRSLCVQRDGAMRAIRVMLDACVSRVRQCGELLASLVVVRHNSVQHFLIPPRPHRRRRKKKKKKAQVEAYTECILCYNEFPAGSFVRRKWVCRCVQDKNDARSICNACLSRVKGMKRCPYCCKGIH